MLAARADQENAVHARQTAAASKPLNQGVQGLAAKTPGNRAPKTPFKVALNDENELDKFGGKGGLGADGKGLGGKQQGGKLKNLFQTPAPRERPALGFKTTNAKATAFQTPAPKTVGPSPGKTQRRTVGRSRIQIHQEVREAEPETDWGNEEIQYIPPRPTPLPDVPSDDEWDQIDFSILKDGNFEAGRLADFYARRQAKDDADEAQWRKEEQERMAREDDQLLEKVMDSFQDSDSETDIPDKKSEAPVKRSRAEVGTLKSRSAVAALSRPAKPSSVPSYAAPTIAAQAKTPASSGLGHKKTPSFSTGANGRAASHSTLGYAKGRAVSNTLRQQPSTGVPSSAPLQVKSKRRDALRELEELVQAKEFEQAGIRMDDLDDFAPGGVSLPSEDEEEEMFQFKIPDA